MIARVAGVLTERSPDAIVIETDSGVGYTLAVPLGVFERLPTTGTRVALHTELVVREDAWLLYGFDTPTERLVFQRLLHASGFGPRLALALLSSLGPTRTVRSIREGDLAALSTVSGIGKKKAERLVLELRDRFADAEVDSAPDKSRGERGERGEGAAAAVRGLEGLGYGASAAEDAVRVALEEDPAGEAAAVMRRALQHLTGTHGGHG